MRRSALRRSILGLTLAATLPVAASVHAAPFTAGNVVVYRVGDGAAGLVNTGAAVFVDEFTPGGTLVQSIALPTTASGGQNQLIASGTATSEGFLTRSADGNCLALTGYATNIPYTSSLTSTTGTAVPRTVALVDAAGNVDTALDLTDFSSGSSPRGVATTNCTDLWLSGGAGGSRYTAVGSTSSAQLSTTVSNLRASAIFDGQLYISTQSGSAVRIGAVGTGTPTVSGQTITNLPGIPTGGSPYGFFLADLSGAVAGVDTLYVADDGAAALTKYSLVAGTWSANGTVGADTDDYRGITGSVSGNSVTLFATRKGGSSATGGGELVALVDASGHNGAFAGAPTLLATAAANSAFRGVALAPSGVVATPTATATATEGTPGAPTATPTDTPPPAPTFTPSLTPTPAPPAAAGQISNPAELITGTSAQGQVGDYLLANGFIRVLIDDIPNPHGFAETGGNIIDAATTAGEDRFASLFTYFNNAFGQQALYETIEVVNAGGGANTAHIRVIGVDSVDPDLAITTDYLLGPNDRYVTLVSQFVNHGTSAVQQMQVGDAIQWGLTTHFAPGWDNEDRNIPGDGHDIGGIHTLTPIWVAGDGQGASYGYTAPTGTLELSNGSSWSDANVKYLDLPANGGTGSYTRQFIVGSGSIASVSNIAFELRGTATGTLSGTITESGSGLPIVDATIAITKTQCLGTAGAVSYTLASSDISGAYAARLEPGTYKVLVEGVGRAPSSCQTVSITNGGSQTLNQSLSGQGTLAWTVVDGTNDPLPAKVSVLYAPVGSEPEGPELGDNHTLVGGYAALSPSGNGSTALAPGAYQVWVSRGIEYDVSIHDVVVTAGATTTINATLTRVVDTTGYLSADLHVHALNSADSGITLEMRAQQAAAEGLEVVIPTDHDFHTDMADAIGTTGLGAWVTTLPGNEVTTNEWGHFNGFPLTVDENLTRDGALDHTGLTPDEIFSGLRADVRDPAVQVNHPRAGGLGYFDLTALNSVTGTSPNPDFSSDFDAVEVFNGKRLYQVPTVRNDWYNLLNSGKRVTGVGNTDTHLVFSQELGYPRNYLAVGTDVPSNMSEAAFRTAVKQQRALFTNAPFVELAVNGVAIGGDVVDSDGSVNAAIRVQAPTWVAIDTLNVIVNGEIVDTIAVGNPSQVERLDTTLPLTLVKDSWIAVEVTGGSCETDSNNACVTAGCPGRLDPVIPPQYGTDPVCPYAHTNAIFVDVDGNGQFDAPGSGGVLVEPIAAVRTVDANASSTRLDETVTVRGTVTVPSYAFDHRNNLVYFQDESIDTATKRSGGMVLFQSGLIQPVLELGDFIEVTGVVTTFNGLTELVRVSTSVLRQGAAVPDPTVVTVTQLRNVANAEQWEGMLVRINDVTITGGTWPAAGDTANITVKDASGAQTLTMRVDGDTDIDGTAQPSQPFDLLAVVGQFDFSAPFNGFYQLLPRQRTDIIEAANSLVIAGGPSVETTACSASIEWYTSKDGNSRVDYGSTSAYGANVQSATLSESHSLSITGLTPDTTYHYAVQSSGVSSVDATFTTAAAADPTITDGPSFSVIDDTTVQVRWSTDVATSGSVDYGFTEALGSTVNASGVTRDHVVTLSGLQAGSTYRYSVGSTSSACGGGSLQTATATFLTPAPAGCPNLQVQPGTLSEGSVGVAYLANLSTNGGQPAYTYNVVGGALPGGLNLMANGTLAGMPNAAGEATFTVRSEDGNGCSATRVYALNIGAPTPTVTATPSATPTATPAPGEVSCPPTPRSDCALPAKQALRLKRTEDPNRQQLLFKWSGGSATIADFGSPIANSTAYALCTYRDSTLAMESIVTADGLWEQTSKGFRYKSKIPNAAGLTFVDMKQGDGKAAISIKGKGAKLAMPVLPLGGNVVRTQWLQDQASGGRCWEAELPAPYKKDTAEQFQDKAP